MAQTFVALNWPADVDAGRGVPLDPTDAGVLTTMRASPRVWQTWKQEWETIGADASVGWNDYTAAAPPCDVLATADGGTQAITQENWPGIFTANGTTVLNGVNLVETTGDSAIAGPLVDQSGSFYQYEVRLNAPTFNCVSQGNCMVNGNLVLPGGDEDTEGAITVKGLWRTPANPDELTNLYSSQVLAVSYEPLANGGILRVCRPETMVLTAMHIAYKDAYMPKCQGGTDCNTDNLWVWATFEGNWRSVPDCDDLPDAGPYNTPTQAIGCGNLPDAGMPTRFCRENAPFASIPIYEFFKKLPEPWSNYAPVAQQWRGGPPAPAANAQLEVFAQESSCLGCHGPAVKTDFVWTLDPSIRSMFTPQACSATKARQSPF